MYITIFLCLLGFSYLFNKMYKIFKINKSLTFEDKNNYNSKLISIHLFPSNVNVDIKYDSTDYYIKNDFNYIIIDFSLDHKQYKLIENKNTFKFPLYLKKDIKKYVFLNKIVQIILYNDNKEIHLTDKLLKFIGPNYDFNYSYINKNTNTNSHLTIKDYLTILKIDYNNNSVLKIYDIINNIHEYSIDSILKWNPTLIN